MARLWAARRAVTPTCVTPPRHGPQVPRRAKVALLITVQWWFFEQVIRDNLDLGRPDQLGLIFDRRVSAAGRTRPAGGSAPA